MPLLEKPGSLHRPFMRAPLHAAQMNASQKEYVKRMDLIHNTIKKLVLPPELCSRVEQYAAPPPTASAAQRGNWAVSNHSPAASFYRCLRHTPCIPHTPRASLCFTLAAPRYYNYLWHTHGTFNINSKGACAC